MLRLRIAACVGTVLCVCGVTTLSAAASPAARAYVPTSFSLPGQLPGANVGSSYSHGLGAYAKGGTGPPYDFNLKGGRPPAGIGLNKVTGVLSGKPSKTGTYSFTVCATGRKRPVSGSAPGNTACDSTRIVVGRANDDDDDDGNAGNPSFTLSANPPGVNLNIDGPRRTTVISVNAFGGFNGKVTFSTVGSPPTGLSLQFLNPPPGTKGTTLSLAAAQDATGGNYRLTILGTSGKLKAQTVVTVTINEPNFAGTYRGTWSGTFTSSGGDGCVINESGNLTVVLVPALPGSYTATFTFSGRISSWSGACAVTGTVDDTFTENATYSNGSVRGTTFTITGNSLSGQRSDTYPGGTEVSSFRAQR